MIENVITSRVDIQGYENIKQLKDAVKALRDQMKSLDAGTEQYRQTADKLVQAEYDLKQAMSNQKKDNSALKGSYNDLANQMSALRKVWKETNDEAVRAEYGAQINQLNTELKALDATTGNYQRNVGDYKNQIKDLRVELSKLTQVTTEYNAKLLELANVTNQYREQQELVKGASEDTGQRLENMTKIGTGMVAGFSALNAAMGLLGKNTEDVQKAMLKVQQTMALVQGLKGMEGMWKACQKLSVSFGLVKAVTVEDSVAQGTNNAIRETGVALTSADSAAKLADAGATGKLTVATSLATKAQKAFNTAVKSNPIGLILTVVASAIALLTTFGDKLDFLSSKEERNRKKQMKQSAERAKELEWEIKENEAKWEGEYKYTDAAYKKYQQYYDSLLDAYQDDADNYRQTAIDKMTYEKEFRQYQRNLAAQAAEDSRKEREEREAELAELRNKLKTAADDWEANVFNMVASTDSAFIKGVKDSITEWNDFIRNNLPYGMGGKSLFIPDKKEFGKSLQELIDLYDEDFFQPILDRNEDGVILATKKNIETIKKARTELQKAMVGDILDNIYEKILNDVSELDKDLSESITDITETFKLNSRVFGTEIEDQIDLEKELHDEREATYSEQIAILSRYLEGVREIYKDEPELYAEWQEKVFKLQYHYNTLKLANENTFLENRSKLTKDAYDRDNDTIKQKTDDILTSLTLEYEKYKSGLDNLWIKNGNLPKVYREYINSEFEVRKAAYEEMIKNLKDAENDEDLLGDEKNKAYEERVRLEMELDDLRTQHEIDNNNLIRESMTITVNAIKDSIQGTSDLLGQFADGYKNMIDAQVNNSKKAIENEYRVGKITKEVYDDKMAAVDASAEKEFETVKNVQAAQAWINTLSASISAYQSLASIPYVGPVLGAAAAAAALQYGYSQVQLIKSTSYGSSSSSNGSSSPTQVTPQIDDYSPNRVSNITGAMETEALANAMRSTPLWISVTDIDRVQGNVKVKEQETTF